MVDFKSIYTKAYFAANHWQTADEALENAAKVIANEVSQLMKKYGRHANGCSVLDTLECDCGFKELLGHAS